MQVFTQIDASLHHWSRMSSPNSLIESLNRFRANRTVVAANATECGHIVLAVLNNELHMDASQYGDNMPCGSHPPAKLNATLNYLRFVLSASFTNMSMPDVAFVLCIDRKGPLLDDIPVFTHFKLHGHQQRGILLPGPLHFVGEYDYKVTRRKIKREVEHNLVPNVMLWPVRHAKHRAATSGTYSISMPAGRAGSSESMHVPWLTRHSRTAWRGRMARNLNCLDNGTWAQLEAVSLTLAHPTLFDARLTRPIDAPAGFLDTCLAKISDNVAYERYLTRIFLTHQTGTARPNTHVRSILSRFRYVFDLPGGLGCPDSLSSSLWGLSSVVVKWDSTCVDWYEPATSNGETHVVVNIRTAKKTVQLLTEHDIAAQYLARRAFELHERILSPAFVTHYVREALHRYCGHFGFGALLQRNVSLAELLAKNGLNMRPVSSHNTLHGTKRHATH